MILYILPCILSLMISFPCIPKCCFTRPRILLRTGILNTYEVYNIPLEGQNGDTQFVQYRFGKVVFGEGILSLARGFIYSGSQSVVMSMWEIEDRSGTEIVKDFYKNLKRGEIKK